MGDAADALPALGYRHLVVAGVAVGDEEALGPAQDGTGVSPDRLGL